MSILHPIRLGWTYRMLKPSLGYDFGLVSLRQDVQDVAQLTLSFLAVEPNVSKTTSASWRLGAPDHITNSRAFEDSLKLAGHSIRDFDSFLRDFIAENFPNERISYEQRIQVGCS
jgi:hypothetical protein